MISASFAGIDRVNSIRPQRCNVGSYALLAKGDVLPSVCVLQALLNRAGAGLTVDGVFGKQTHEAVCTFQRQRRLIGNGIADQPTWKRLIFRDVLPLVDCIDVFYEEDAKDPHIPIYKSQAKYIVEKTGGRPLMVGGMSNGLQQVAVSLRSARDVFLLRFIGHGYPGVQAISFGIGGWWEHKGDQSIPHSFTATTSALGLKNQAEWPSQGVSQIMASFGSVEMHGCHVSHGPQGHEFVRRLARVLGVPVTAGLGKQRSAIRFDGPTFTALPKGGSLKSWWQSARAEFSRGTPP